MERISRELTHLAATGNYRRLPAGESRQSLVDFSSNDYLGIAEEASLRHEFMVSAVESELPLTSSASRLLAHRQEEYVRLENLLCELYGRDALLFNSGYHANVGLIQAIADKSTLVVADKLVHASIIDGIRLSGAPLARFRHNDMDHLRRIISSHAGKYPRTLIIAESVYSMDGDCAPLGELAEIKRHTPGAILYIDEAHAFGVCGNDGLGLVKADGLSGDVDVALFTLGKAAASVGAFAVLSPLLRDFAINKARSLIFSTSLPPLNIAWSRFVIERLPSMTERRLHLRALSRRLAGNIGCTPGHIVPFIIGDASEALRVSEHLLQQGLKVLPIRTPTVPPGTERLRISLSSAMTTEEIDRLSNALKALKKA